MDTDQDGQIIPALAVRTRAPSVAESVVPLPRVSINVRPATLNDVAFMDGLQRQYPRQLGHFATEWFEGYIKSNGVLVAEANGQRVGYIISRDRYQKRDELGVIYQLCVAPGQQRKLVGAALVKAAFERSAYGCKLYCCWCAQDISANYFWESIGFVPVAFRAGSRTKSRVHIFWQRRICEGDRTTPYWFPAQTGGGAIREDRLVLPIPPGTHWSDAKPIVLPGEEQGPELTDQTTERSPAEDVPTRTRRRTKAERTEKKGPYKIARGVLWFGTSSPHPPAQASKAAKRKRPAKAKAPVKNDPHHVAAARELRDRYLEHVNAGQMELTSAAKYDVARTLNTIDGSRQLSVAGRAALESHARPSTPRRLPNAA